MSEPSQSAPADGPGDSGATDGARSPATDAADARVVGVDSDDADELLAVLGSDSARTVLAALHEEPAAPSRLADRLDASLQQVHYHVENLTEAGLVEPVDTATAESGQEMTVYGPADGPVVVFAGGESGDDDLRSALSGLLSGLGILAVASLLVQEVLGEGVDALFGGGETADGYQVATRSAGEAAATGPPPGVVFFLGGAAVLLAAATVWYWRQQ
jgi:DNA-binding transcriptional ArsR family regulator